MHVVLNWLWQGAVVGAAAALVVRAIPASRPHVRYRVLWTACAALLALPAVSFLRAAAAAAPVAVGAEPAAALVLMPYAWWTSPTIAVAAWIVWFSAHLGQAAFAAVALGRARKRCRACPPALEARLPHWSRWRATGRPARLVLSDDVRAAAVLGGGPPLVAVAPAVLDRIDDADLDRVLVHEWAHVQRRDDLAQIVQLAVRAAAGWHPAVWWVDRQLHAEREAACDQTAIGITGSAKAYANCLLNLARVGTTRPRWLPAPAALSSTGLRRRIVRIAAAPSTGAMTGPRGIATFACALPAVLAVMVGGLRLVEPASLASLALDAPAVWQAESASAMVAARWPLDPAEAAVSPAGQRPGAPVPSRTSSATAAPANALPEHPAISPAVGSMVAEGVVPARSSAALVSSTMPLVPSRREASAGALADPDAPVAGAPIAGASRDAAPWSAAVEAGRAVGRGSENAATATAGFFTRFGRRVAATF